jgi:hypothetical protein
METARDFIEEVSMPRGRHIGEGEGLALAVERTAVAQRDGRSLEMEHRSSARRWRQSTAEDLRLDVRKRSRRM